MVENKMHIFLADDDADDRVLFYEAIRLTAPNAELTMAGNGVELLEVLLNSGTTLPRIVFLDLNMPIKNGQECLMDIRRNEKLKNLPVIIYSTSDNPDDINQTYEGGADFYLFKPSSFKELQSLVNNVLSSSGLSHVTPNRENFMLEISQ